MNEKINIGVIGLGHWGPNHIRVFNNFHDTKVLAVSDINPECLRRAADLFPSIQIESDYKNILKCKDIHAVIIATPTSTHSQLTKEAILAGKHVLCEKPLCQSSKQASELIKLSKERKIILMIGYIFLYNSGIKKIKTLLDEGDFGDIYYLSSTRTNLGPVRKDVNAAIDLAVHDISIFNWLLESVPYYVSAHGASYLQSGIQDVVFINLRYPNNVLANIEVSWLNPKKARQMTLVANKKMLTWDDLNLNSPVAIYDKGANVVSTSADYGNFLHISMWEGDVRLPKVEVEEPLKSQNYHFIQSIKSKEPVFWEDKFTYGVTKVLESINRSLNEYGKLVEIA